MRLLLERSDVKADSMDDYSRTPLSWAADRGHDAVVRLWLERDDFDADSKDGYGHTPLSWAVKLGHRAVMRLLVMALRRAEHRKG